MIGITLALAGLGVVVGLVLLPRRMTLQPSALGTMSASWLAEERANERPGA